LRRQEKPLIDDWSGSFGIATGLEISSGGGKQDVSDHKVTVILAGLPEYRAKS